MGPWERSGRAARDPDRELRGLQRRFRAIGDRYDRSVRRRRLVAQWAKTILFLSIGLFLGTVALVLSPFAPIDTLKHIWAAPNCSAARSIGLAPAREGQPGYWSRHDADGDGIACEVWPR